MFGGQNLYALRLTDRKRDFVNIGNPYGGRLNALQIRIIQELVKDQYPDCRTFPRNDRDFMQVIPWNRARDTQVRPNASAPSIEPY